MPNVQNPFQAWIRRWSSQPRVLVDIPTTVPTTEVIFLIMRRMRVPIIVVIAMFTFCTAGMMVMPGVDPEGNPHRHNIFDAFYQMTITLTTVGFTEAPYPFSYPQRMWMTLSIFLLVISWAYAIAVFFALVQSAPFQAAVDAQQFRRQVRRLVEPFVIVAGYGDAGRIVGADLDEHYRRFVVIDKNEQKVQSVVSGQLTFDVPAVQGDCSAPELLGIAGLVHRECEGVLALTDDDDANLAVVMTTSLFRPDLPVFGRCATRRTGTRMEHFAPGSAINADDRFGDYLALSIHQPVNHQLLRWLMDNDDEQLLPARRDLSARRWVVCAEGEFGDAVVSDLDAIGVSVELVGPADEPDLSGSVGFIAGTDNDTVNIAMAEHARAVNPAVYLVVRQRTKAMKPLLARLGIESVYIATEVVAREVLARTLTPVFWTFAEHVLTRDEAWATEVRDHLVQRCGQRTPEREVLTLSDKEAPAIADWLRRGRSLPLQALIQRPDDRTATLPLTALVLIRDGKADFMPPEDTPVALGDQILLVGSSAGLSLVREICHYPATVEYLATGRDAPLTWAWSRLTARPRAGTD
jgi:Trk K+ transport system NAD-binding subunit